MTFYRVSYSVHGGNSGGFTWHTSLRAARKAALDDYRLDPTEYDHHAATKARIDTVKIAPTRAGILAALISYASHPDNG